jgi:hypothetical protein
MSTTFADSEVFIGSNSLSTDGAAIRSDSDDCVATFAETALEVALRQGVNQPSIDLEIALWHSLQNAAETDKRRMLSGTGSLRADRKSLLATLTDAAYRTALGSGLKGSFIDLEIGLWNAFRDVRRWGVSQKPPTTRRCVANQVGAASA